MAIVQGNAGAPGVTVSWTGTASGSTIADDTGDWSTILGAGTYTFTPTLTGYTFSPVNIVKVISGASLIVGGVNFVATETADPNPYSVPDCRNYGNFPNSAENINATKMYTIQTESRAAGEPADCRVSKPVPCGTYPQNSRTPGTYGPGE